MGALRWQPPQPASRFQGVFQATAFGSSCPQVATPFGKASVNEDCLFLNVFTPATPRANMPVMVYFHGGDFVVGEGSDYDPTSLVTEGNAIVVTINYRLGVFGFLADSALSAESPDHVSGNYGIMDQQAALRWVQANIRAFGGDPGNVTIFGQSAGGDSVISQLTSPAAAGLFQHAIVQSGAYDLAPATLAQGEAYGAAFAASAGCTDNTAACLRSLSTAQLVAASAPSFGLSQLESLGPVIGGPILPLTPAAAFSSGQFNHVPVINGTNGKEGSLFIALAFDLKGAPLSAAGYATAVQALVGAQATPYALQAYPLSSYGSPDQALAAIFTDAGFACPALITDTLLAKYVPVYAYEFNDTNAPTLQLPPVSFPYGPTHTDELPYLFNSVDGLAPNFTPGQRLLSGTMIELWTRFAAKGKITPGQGFSWQQFEASADNIALLVPPSPQTDTSFAARHQCGLWVPLLGYDIPVAAPASANGPHGNGHGNGDLPSLH